MFTFLPITVDIFPVYILFELLYIFILCILLQISFTVCTFPLHKWQETSEGGEGQGQIEKKKKKESAEEVEKQGLQKSLEERGK